MTVVRSVHSNSEAWKLYRYCSRRRCKQIDQTHINYDIHQQRSQSLQKTRVSTEGQPLASQDCMPPTSDLLQVQGVRFQDLLHTAESTSVQFHRLISTEQSNTELTLSAETMRARRTDGRALDCFTNTNRTVLLHTIPPRRFSVSGEGAIIVRRIDSEPAESRTS